MNRLIGKVAVVTGSTQGIGFAVAKRLAAEGAKVVVSSRQEANVKEAVEKLKHLGYQDNIIGTVCHVSKPEDRKRLYEEAFNKFGGIDILVSSAGVNPHIGSTADCPEDKWDKIFDVNVKSSFLLIKEVLPYLKGRNGGSIVNMSSIAGLKPIQEIGAYSVSKSALIAMTKVFANELASLNIRVNCVAPGMIRTLFTEFIFRDKPLQDALVSTIPMGRAGEPSDIEGVTAFLCSDEARYITGETIVVAGGTHSRI
ncbi:dehydrogenase/reductase SDR family member 4-like [Planococcus citri]|uniref:dehydrogenase/reductase SDR family member 4-like n=1 Tax=Planococcus citri TaxID=170843 RepID=UPI0031F97A83